MAIVKMSNFSLFAFDSERKNLLQELQKFKYVHFLNLENDESLKEIGLKNIELPEGLVAVDEEISKVKYIMDTLSKHFIKETGIKAMQKGLETYDFKELEDRALKIDYLSLYDQLKGLNAKKETLLQELSKVHTSINELRPWVKLKSPIKDLKAFEKSEVILGTIPKKLKQKIEAELLVSEYTYFEILSEDKDNLYILCITSNSESELIRDILKSNNFSNIRLLCEDEPEKEIIKYEKRIKELETEISAYNDSIKNLSDKLPEVEIVYEYLMNQKLKVQSSESFLTTENVNVIEGYIPTDREEKFKESVKLALGDNYYLEVKEADKDDSKAPILLKNSKFVESFQSLTGMYALPNYNEIDPTPLFAVFYAFFFGMMVGDFGYGLIMLVGTILALKMFNLSEGMRNTVRFYFYLSFSTIFWGLIYGSFFGGVITLPALINPAEQYNELLIISIAMGVIHIFYALGIKAYLSIRDKRYLDALYDVGFWYMALTGGIVYLISIVMTIPDIAKTIAFAVMVIGMVGIVLTGGREASGIGGKLAGGLYNLYGISSYVGDFVSYSRLMALGLSGGFIASAINMMVGMLFDKGIIGIIAGIVVFLIGQAFNIFLSILGAYVHSIRLTYVEFFGKFYNGGGKAFKLFRNNPKYINLK